jgi:tetratricopeptide (TPR) repeat protein
MRTIDVLVWVAGLFAVAGFALAARNVADSSRMKNREWGIVTCARVLQSSNETAKNRAIAYFNRAIACKADGDDGRAIADYTEAIRLDPKLAIAYYQRGTAYHALGDFDRAIADYTEAIRLDPKLGPKAATERAVSEKAAAQRVAEEAKRLVAQKAAAEEAAASSSKGATERVRAEKAVTEEAKRRAAQRQRDAAAKNAIHDVAEGPGPNNELATITKRGEQLQKLPIGNIFLAAPKTMKVNEVRSVEARVGINVPM